jgi:hypothetical protein
MCHFFVTPAKYKWITSLQADYMAVIHGVFHQHPVDVFLWMGVFGCPFAHIHQNGVRASQFQNLFADQCISGSPGPAPTRVIFGMMDVFIFYIVGATLAVALSGVPAYTGATT